LNLTAEQPDKFAESGRRQEAFMNHSIYSADRSTHLKIVVVALVAAIAVAGLGIAARATSDDGYTQTARVIKAGKPVTITSSNASMVR
jgi:hypothetical protein